MPYFLFSAISFKDEEHINMLKEGKNLTIELTEREIAKNKAKVNDKNKYGDTALICASREGYKDIVEILIKNNANVNDKDEDGNTALIWASREG